MTTGRRIARLGRPGMDAHHFQFAAEGRWVTAIESKSTIVVYSADDGREITRVTDPNLGNVQIRQVHAPTGRRIITYIISNNPRVTYFNIWEAGTWHQVLRKEYEDQPNYDTGAVRELSDNQFLIRHGDRWFVFRGTETEPNVRFYSSQGEFSGDTFHQASGSLVDVRTGQRLLPPPGRRFHPDLARFAWDGRFVPVVLPSFDWLWSLIDTVTDKQLELGHFYFYGGTPPVDLPGVGLCGIARYVSRDSTYTDEIRLIPSATRLNLPPDVLELWLQVALCGELGPDGDFAKWDEPTWERKRQELAARPAPFADFPFPGHVATDRLHWLRKEYYSLSDDQPAEKLRLVEELLRRSAESPDPHEAVRWRIERMKLVPELAPPPRPVNP